MRLQFESCSSATDGPLAVSTGLVREWTFTHLHSSCLALRLAVVDNEPFSAASYVAVRMELWLVREKSVNKLVSVHACPCFCVHANSKWSRRAHTIGNIYSHERLPTRYTEVSTHAPNAHR